MEKILQTLLGELQKISRAETVVGEAIKSGDSTIVPICRVHIGFAAGGAGDSKGPADSSNPSRYSGIGGGVRVEPVACVVVNGAGTAQLLALSGDVQSTAAKVLDLVPEVMDRLGLDKQDEKSKNDKAKK